MPRLTALKNLSLDQVSFACLVLLATLLPFELTRPIVSLGPIDLSSVEVPLYLFIALWLITRFIERRTRWTPVHSAAAIWMSTMLVSAFFAQEFRLDALKFTLRSIGGCLLFFASVDICRNSKRLVVVTTALAVGAFLSALMGLAEIYSPAAAQFLMAFKTHTSLIGGFVRASGTFEYANIAGMYWEATLAIVLITGIWWSLHRAQRRWWIMGLLGSIGLGQAIVLSASRAALFGSIVVLVIMIAFSRAPRSIVRLPATLALIALIGLAIINFVGNPLFGLRLQSENNADWYRAEYRAENLPATIQTGQRLTVTLHMTNTSIQPWLVTGERPVLAGYHWLDVAKQNFIIFETHHQPLPRALQPDEHTSMSIEIIAPEQSGTYFLQWDLVQEKVTWFSAVTRQFSGADVQVVSGPDTSTSPAPKPQAILNINLTLPPRSDLWRAALQMWRESPLLGVGPDNFRHLYGHYVGWENFNDAVNANNLYFETLADTGVMGALAFGWFVFKLISLGRKKWRNLNQPSAQILALGLSVALAAFFIHGVVDTFLAFTPTYSLFWLLCGLWVSMLLSGER